MDFKHLTTKEVARLCHVSDATVKRWEDAGLLRSERTSGGHRRFRAEEIVRFQREQGLGLEYVRGGRSTARAQTRRRTDKRHSESLLFNSLIAGAEDEATTLLVKAHLNGKSLTYIFDDLISPAMHRVGELWFKGELSITQEHLATRTAYSAIYRLRHLLPVPEMSGRLALCCGVEGDFHELPVHLAQMTMENEGVEAMSFGSNTPLYSLTEETVQHVPDLICISGTIIGDVERLARDYREFRERAARLKIPVILGGRAFRNARVRERFPAELYAGSFGDVAEFIGRSIRDEQFA